MTGPFHHDTVLLTEAVSLLQAEAGRVIVDGTLGGGGHSEALLERGATVIGLDRDPTALAAASARLARFGERFQPRQATFGALAQLLPSPVDGVLLDLGVSSPQLDVAARGFSFMQDGPLDMRMSQAGETAAELIARLSEAELADVIYQLGEERLSRPIARALKAARPTTTAAAVDAIKAAVPRKAWPKDTHVATRTFQALRMAVNGELDELGQALGALPAVLKPGGRAAIITFHSLEDRAVKHAFRALCGEEPTAVDPRRRELDARLPKATPAFRSLTKKPLTASEAELRQNPRSRSAKLRAVEKCA